MPRILIVEDETLIAMSLEFLLEGEGYTVRLCSNGRRALSVINEFKPDLIITDYMMPEMNGAALITHLRECTQTRDIPIIITTAISEEILAERGIQYDHYCQKPVKDDALLSVINSLIRQKGD